MKVEVRSSGVPCACFWQTTLPWLLRDGWGGTLYYSANDNPTHLRRVASRRVGRWGRRGCYIPACETVVSTLPTL